MSRNAPLASLCELGLYRRNLCRHNHAKSNKMTGEAIKSHPGLAEATPHLNRGADSHEIRPLTGIRGFAAALVVLFHFYASWIMLLPCLRPFALFASRGHLGVDLFFILSGFILSYVYSAGDTRLGVSEYRRFLWLRLARIYPTHLATLTFLLFMVLACKHFGIALSGDYPASGLPAQLTMTHAWPWVHGGQWNYPSWSISAEWFAYLLWFPVVWYALRLRSPGETSFFVISYAVLALYLFAITPPAQFASVTQVSCEFISGGMLFGAYKCAGSVTGFCQRYVSIIFAILIALLCFYPINSRLASGLVVLLFPLLLVGLTSERSLISKFFSTSPMLWLGRISYSLYMTHGISQKIIKVLLPSERYVNSSLITRGLMFSANILLILLFAVALYYIVEIPSRRYLRRIAVSRSHSHE
jgi:peptidoglycan/LPS O-acetylase OafA/YrhL